MNKELIERLRIYAADQESDSQDMTEAADALEAADKRIEQLEGALNATPAVIPTSWLDPMLSGKDALISIPSGCPDIERLLGEIKDRLECHAKAALKEDE